MRKKIFKTMIASVLSLAIVGTSVAMPFGGVQQVKAYENYETGHKYTTETLNVGETASISLHSNASDKFANSSFNGTYRANEDENLDSDYIRTALDRVAYLASYKAYCIANGSIRYEYYESDPTKAITSDFSFNGERFEYNYSSITGAYTYEKKSLNPNISYGFASSNPAVVTVTPYEPTVGEFVKSAKIAAVAASGNKYITVTATRTNARTGVATSVYKYIEVAQSSLWIEGINESLIKGTQVKVFEDYTDANADAYTTGIVVYDIDRYISNTAEGGAYVLSSSNEAVAAIRTYGYKNSDGTIRQYVYNTYKNGEYDDNTSTNDLAVVLVGAGTATLTVTEYLPSGATRVVGTINVIVNNDDIAYGTTAANAKIAVGETYNAFQFYNTTSYTNSAKYTVSKLSKKQKKIISLDKKTGLVTAKKAGSVTLKVKMTYANGKNTVASKVATLKITVMKSTISASAKALTLNVKDTYKVPIAYKNVNASYSYKSDASKVASVNKYGIIKAKKSGDATITVTEKITTKVKKKKKTTKKELGKLTVHVDKDVEDTLSFRADLYNRANGKASQTAMMSVNKGVKFDMNSYVDPDTSYSTNGIKLTFKSSKKSVAKIGKTSGIVTAKKTGKTTITVKSGKAKAKLTLYVVAPRNNTADDAQINAAAAAFSKLYGAQEVNTFKKASKLYNKYYKAIATRDGAQVVNGDLLQSGTVGYFDIETENNNYVQFPNREAGDKAQVALDNYFTQVNANYKKASNFKVTGLQGTTATLTFNNKLTKNDVLQYCYENNKPYSKSAKVAYSLNIDASNYKYMSVPEMYTGFHSIKLPDGSYAYVYDMYAVNGAGQYVERDYEDWDYLTGAYGKVTESVIQPQYVNIGGDDVTAVAYRKAGSKKATVTLTKEILLYNAYGIFVKDAADPDYVKEAEVRANNLKYGVPAPADHVIYAISPATAPVNVTVNVGGTKIGTASATYTR